MASHSTGQCAVCLDDPSAPFQTVCQHVFCYACISPLLNPSAPCPVCGHVLGASDIKPKSDGKSSDDNDTESNQHCEKLDLVDNKDEIKVLEKGKNKRKLDEDVGTNVDLLSMISNINKEIGKEAGIHSTLQESDIEKFLESFSSISNVGSHSNPSNEILRDFELNIAESTNVNEINRMLILLAKRKWMLTQYQPLRGIGILRYFLYKYYTLQRNDLIKVYSNLKSILSHFDDSFFSNKIDIVNNKELKKEAHTQNNNNNLVNIPDTIVPQVDINHTNTSPVGSNIEEPNISRRSSRRISRKIKGSENEENNTSSTLAPKKKKKSNGKTDSNVGVESDKSGYVDNVIENLLNVYDTNITPPKIYSSDDIPASDVNNYKDTISPDDVKRIDKHIEDLAFNYETVRRTGQVAYFKESLEEFTKHKGIKLLSDLAYSDSSSNGTSAIVSSIDFDKDDEFFATAGVMKKIRIYSYNNVVTKYKRAEVNLFSDRMEELNNDSISDLGGNTEEITERPQIRPSRNLRTMSRSKDIFGSNEDLDPVARYPILSLNCTSKLSCVTFNPYIKQHLLSSNYEGKLHLYNVSTGHVQSEYNEHDKRAWSVAWSQQDPLRFASGGDDTKVKIWSISSPRSDCTIESKANVCSVVFNPLKSHEIAFGSADHNAHIYDLRNASKPVMILKGHTKAVSYVRYMNQDTLVTASTDCTLRSWDLTETIDTGSSFCKRIYSGHMNEKNFVGMDIDPTGKYLACGSENNNVFIYYKDVAKPLFTEPFSPNILGYPKNDPAMFVSSICWARKTPNVFIAANSGGHVRLLRVE